MKNVFLFLLISFPVLASAKDFFEFYGYAQLDYIQDFQRTNPNWEATLRPSKIPTQPGEYGSDGQAILSSRQTRLGFQANKDIDGDDLYAKVEFDFFGVGDDEGQTTIRLRHAYGQWQGLLAGQTYTLFMDPEIMPDVIDYWGPNGVISVRTPQIRWTLISGKNNFAIALEKPSEQIDPGQIRELDPQLGANLRSDSKIPDLTLQYAYKDDWGHVQLAGLLASLGFETINTPDNEPSDKRTGWGLNLTSKINVFDEDSLRAGVVFGEGIGSYVNDGGVDLAPQGSPGALEPSAVPQWGLSAFYEYFWKKTLSTTIGYSYTEVNNRSFQSNDAFKKGEYSSVNLLWRQRKDLLMGAEFLYGSREDKNGDHGQDTRVQFSVRYSFNAGFAHQAAK